MVAVVKAFGIVAHSVHLTPPSASLTVGTSCPQHPLSTPSTHHDCMQMYDAHKSEWVLVKLPPPHSVPRQTSEFFDLAAPPPSEALGPRLKADGSRPAARGAGVA